MATTPILVRVTYSTKLRIVISTKKETRVKD